MLLSYHTPNVIEAGCDEAGRGCLAGPVCAAAVILPADYTNGMLNDSKQLTERRRYQLRQQIEHDAVAWAVAWCSPEEIDTYNILRCSIMAMQRALDKLTTRPEHIIVDGNRWMPYKAVGTETIVPANTVVKGDATYLSIAAASILAKTYRDDLMNELHEQFPHYQWQKNKGYPTVEHRSAIAKYGITEHHRKTFRLLDEQTYLF